MSLTKELALLRDEIQKHALDFGLDFFETIFELLDYDQINTVASLGGFPVRYPHWRFGMEYDQLSKSYTYGLQKIYELVINNDPSYAYLMKSNNMVDQKLVMAHVYGHVDFFKNNYWFSKTNRKMIDVMANHGVRVRQYMEQYGVDEVETFIDRCLSIENLIDPHLPFVQKQSKPRTLLEEKPVEQAEGVGRLKTNRSYMDSFINPPDFIAEQKSKLMKKEERTRKNPAEPQRDVLKFLMDFGQLDSWQVDVLSMIREEAYYYVPQWQTKILNEGWASFWHSRIMTTRALKDHEVIDYADHHAGVTASQPGRINPYKIGIELLRDIEERWDKGRFGKEYDECENLVEKKNWDKKLGLGREKIFEVRRVCNDVTFIDEYLTPEFCERLKLYNYQLNKRTNQYEIVDRDFKKMKQQLLFSLTNMGQPLIFVVDGNYQNKGELLLLHQYEGSDLDLKTARETLKNVSEIWGRPVHIETMSDGSKKLCSWGNGEFSEKALGH